MKNILTLIIAIACSLSITAQAVKFEYDAAGNRVRRTYIPLNAIPKSATDTTELANETIAKELSETEKKFNFENLADGKIKVFPNPTEGSLMLRLENISNVETIQVNLYNSSGILLQSKMLSSAYSEFDMNDYSPGVYILHVVKQNQKCEYKVIKN